MLENIREPQERNYTTEREMLRQAGALPPPPSRPKRSVYLSTDGGVSWSVVAPTDPRSLKPLKVGKPAVYLTLMPLVPPDAVHPELN